MNNKVQKLRDENLRKSEDIQKKLTGMSDGDPGAIVANYEDLRAQFEKIMADELEGGLSHKHQVLCDEAKSQPSLVSISKYTYDLIDPKIEIYDRD